MTPELTLNSGSSMPQLGLGTYPMHGDELRDAIVVATEAGYRLIDSALRYGNEEGVGLGIAACGLDRSELFITTKLDGEHQGDDRAIDGLDSSLERLGTDYVDLLLMHWPLPQRGQFISTWKTFEKLAASGKARSIGVSNFKPAHLDALLAETGIVPAVNQIELSPELTRTTSRDYNAAHGIITQAWSPFGGEAAGVLDNATIQRIAADHGRTPSQIVLRWCVEIGISAVAKSANPQRIKQNIEVFDFSLTSAEVAELSALDNGEAAAQDSDRIGH
jgi:2,5-diketo-D-gluconate reductase A